MTLLRTHLRRSVCGSTVRLLLCNCQDSNSSVQHSVGLAGTQQLPLGQLTCSSSPDQVLHYVVRGKVRPPLRPKRDVSSGASQHKGPVQNVSCLSQHRRLFSVVSFFQTLAECPGKAADWESFKVLKATDLASSCLGDDPERTSSPF